NNRGGFYDRRGQLDKALADFSAAIKLDRKLAPAWADRGLVYGKLGQLDKALADLSKAIELDGKDAQPWHNRGVLYLKLRQFDQALADLSKAIKLDPKNDLAWNNRGVAYEKMGQLDKALADYREFVALQEKLEAQFPARPEYHTRLALNLHYVAGLAVRVKQPAEACQLLEKAITHQPQALRLEPKNAGYRQQLRDHYLALTDTFRVLGKHEQSARAARQLPQVMPDGPHYTRAAWFLAACVPLAEKDARLTKDKRGE